MTRNEFMTRLFAELRRNHVADAADIEEEYEQHFAFKLADGYSEEEIAAKPGAPEALAAQFSGGSVLYGENPHWEIYLSLFCHGALFFCGFVTVSTLPCTGGVWHLVGGTAYVALRAALLRPLAGDTGRLLIYILLDAVPVRQVLPEALWCVAVPAFYLLAAAFVVLTARALPIPAMRVKMLPSER